MTAHVPGHIPERSDADDTYVKRMGEHVAENVARLERYPRSFQRLFDQTGLYLRARLSLDPSGARIESWEAMVVTMQVGSALFAAAGAIHGTVRTRIGGEMRDVPAVGPQYFAHPGSWLTSFYSAVVCRDQPRMNQLCAFGPELLRASEATIDAFQYHWVDALQTYWLERPALVDKLTTAIETSHPDTARIAPRDLLDQQLYPPINLFHRFIRRDHEGFNEALVEALEAHRAYWTADEDRAESVEGSLALGPLAITCLAYDAGFPIEVESPYLPKYFLNRDWLGEFPT